jgi:serine/threonine-protein kinase HipA
MDTESLVYVDLNGQPILVGRVWARMRRGRDSASFEYDEGWLARADRFALEPALRLGAGPFHTPADKPMFGAIGDSAPALVGGTLIRRAERRQAERAGRRPHPA